jgi:hypothetical protein
VQRKTGIAIGVIVLLIAVVYGWTLLSTSGGRPVAPLDDAYIHFQYARQIARGHPWQYNDGDPPSTGATSPLYPFVLAAGYLIGFSGERLVWFALGIGVLCLALSAWLIFCITSLLLERTIQPDIALARLTPLGAAVLFLLTGAIQWTYLSAMESGLFTVFVLAAFFAFLAQSGPANTRFYAHPAFWIALATLTRPEGLILAGVLWLVAVAQTWQLKETLDWKAKAVSIAKDTWPYTLAVLAGILSYLLNVALTGSPIATGAQAKSWFGNVPFRAMDILESILANYRRILARFVAGMLAPREWVLFPGLLLLAALGWIALLRRQRWAEVILTVGWFALGTLATASLITATWHFGRYQVPFLAILAPIAALGVVTLIISAEWLLMKLRLPRRVPELFAAGLLLALFGAALISTLRARELYELSIGTVTGQHLVIGDWIRDNLPPGTRVGVHDTGAIRYVSQRPTYDMIGLTTQGAATAFRHGSGSIFERLEHSPSRPIYFASYPDAVSLPYIAATDLFAVELLRTTVPDFANAAGPVQSVYQTDWHLADSGNQIYQPDMLRRTSGMKLLDRLDLADLEEEAAHDLTFWEGHVRPGFPTEVQQYRYRTDPPVEVLDGGRLVNGGLAFRVAAQPTEPMLLIARIHPMQAGAVRVMVDGHDLGLWRYPALPGEWLETAFFIPAGAVTQDRVEIRLEVDTSDPNFRHFAPYHLWVWGGQPTPLTLYPEQPLTARLGADVELLGYDLASTDASRGHSPSFQPGENASVVLYWRAISNPDEDAKVFIHLYDETGEIVVQEDHRPYYGTRPPYTWAAKEILDDPYSLFLPPGLPSGSYTLAVGMYDPVSGARLPVDADPAYTLSENRVLLGTINVVPEAE